MVDSVSVRAPGKLFVAGEHAVVSPGEPAVLVAVDRCVEVTVAPAAGDVGTVHSPALTRHPLRWRIVDGTVAVDAADHPYSYAVAAIDGVERLREETGAAARPYDVRIVSDLDDGARKYGLGSSAAVTAGVVRAVARFHGLDLPPLEEFRLALLATIRVAPRASGGDLAASVFGGWVGYRSPDRERLRALADTGPLAPLVKDVAHPAWDGCEIARLTAPADLRLLIGWTGSPASTVRLVDAVDEAIAAGRVDHPRFLAEARASTLALWTALEDGDADGAVAAIRRGRAALVSLGAQAGAPIETPLLATLADAAERAGAAGKPSGAGGGDCGIVLASPAADLDEMLAEWDAEGVMRLPFAVLDPEESAHGR